MENEPTQSTSTTVKQKNPFKIATIILSAVVLVFAGFLTYSFVKKDDSAVSNGQTTSDNPSDETDVSVVDGKVHYALDTRPIGRRYFLVFDKKLFENVPIGSMQDDYRNFNTSILDMVFPNQASVKNIDLAGHLKSFYDSKIANLPTILAEGSNIAKPKSECTDFKATYGSIYTNSAISLEELDELEKKINVNEDVPFMITYVCMDGTGEQGVGSEYFVFNIPNEKLTRIGES